MSGANKVILALIIIVIILAAIWYAFGRKPVEEATPKAKEPIRIGAILPLTGSGASYGQKTQKGIEIALQELREKGIKVEIIYEDSQGDSKTAVSAIQKLISVDRVPVIIGPVLSDSVLACAPVANGKGVVLFITAAGSDQIREAGDYIFRNRASASFLSVDFAKYIYEDLGVQDIAVLYENSANSIDYKDSFVAQFEQMRGEIILIEAFEKKESDFRLLVTKLKESEPKAVFITGHATELGSLLKQAKEMDFESRFFSTPGVESDDFFEVAKGAGEGLILISESPDLKSNNLVFQTFREKYKAQTNGQEPDFLSVNGYDALKIIVVAGEEYGFTSEGIKKGLYGIESFKGAGGILTFDHNGEIQKPVMIKTVKNGQFVPYEEE